MIDSTLLLGLKTQFLLGWRCKIFPLYIQLRRFQYRPTPFISNGKPRANLRVYTKASLFIDSAFKSTYMACCDQPFTGTSLAPQLTLLKAGIPLVVNHMPKSSHYPIYLVGEGTLKSTGAQGWFFFPPNLYASNKPLTLVGRGPHKVYWLGADHPDICPGQQLYFEDELLGTSTEPQIDTLSLDAHFDILGRPNHSMEAIELRKTGRKWLKVIKVK